MEQRDSRRSEPYLEDGLRDATKNLAEVQGTGLVLGDGLAGDHLDKVLTCKKVVDILAPDASDADFGLAMSGIKPTKGGEGAHE